MPSERQSVQTSTRLGAAASWLTRSSRSAGGSVPVTATTSTPEESRCLSSSATYSAVGMKRQKRMGLYPSRSSSLTSLTALMSLASPSPFRPSAVRAISRRRRRLTAPSFSGSSASLPGITSMPSADSSSIRSSTVRRPMASASSGDPASAVEARLRRVAAAAAGLLASDRSKARADHQRTR